MGRNDRYRDGAGAILQLFREGEVRTRAELRRLTGLSRSTIEDRIEALFASHFLIEVGKGSSTGGRPASQIALDTQSSVVIGMELGSSHSTVVVADLSGRLLSEHSQQLNLRDGPELVLARLLDTGVEQIAALGLIPDQVVGVGVGVPSPVEPASGRPLRPRLMPGWDSFDVPALIRLRFDGQVVVDKDANLMAVGEHRSRFPGIDNLIFVKVGTSIDAGVVMGGALQRGGAGLAGGLGRMRAPDGYADAAGLVSRFNLDSVASGTALVAQLRSRGVEVHDIEDLVSLVGMGDPEAIAATRQAGRVLGEALSDIVNVLNPSVVILGGRVARAGEQFIAGVREALYTSTTALAARDLQVASSHSGRLAGAIGASVAVLDLVLDAAAVDDMVGSGRGQQGT